jgi:hypothetical protein
MATPQGIRRKAAFRSALVLAGKTQGQWAADVGVSLGHLSEVLHEKRQSVALVAKIDEFIAAAPSLEEAQPAA